MERKISEGVVVRTNLFLVAGVSAGMDRLATTEEDELGLSELLTGTPEEYYDEETMTWGGNGCRHSQRCNALKMTDGGHNPLPDNSDSY